MHSLDDSVFGRALTVPAAGVDASTDKTGADRERTVLDRTRSRSMALDVAIVSGVSLVLGLFRLGAPSLWVDESFTARAAHASDPTTSTGITGCTTRLSGRGRRWPAPPMGAPFPSVVGAMIASALVVVSRRKLFDRWVGLVAGLLIATSPFVVQWSQQARGYTFLLALSRLDTCSPSRPRSGARRDWTLYGSRSPAVLVWHPVGGLLLVVPHAVLGYQRRGRVLPHGLLAAVIICALGVPWAAQIAMRSTGEGVAMDWLKAPLRKSRLERCSMSPG